MKRSELKALVKECLLELLNEGLGGTVKAPAAGLIQQGVTESRRMPRPAAPQRQHPGLDNRAINEIVGQATKDPTLAAIFADTAATTLAEQAAHEKGKVIAPEGSDQFAKAVANVDPTDLFAGAADKWAALAFMDGPKR